MRKETNKKTSLRIGAEIEIHNKIKHIKSKHLGQRSPIEIRRSNIEIVAVHNEELGVQNAGTSVQQIRHAHIAHLHYKIVY